MTDVRAKVTAELKATAEPLSVRTNGSLSQRLRSVSERRTDERQNNITFEYYSILPQKHKFIYTGGQNVREKNTSKKRNQA